MTTFRKLLLSSSGKLGAVKKVNYFVPKVAQNTALPSNAMLQTWDRIQKTCTKKYLPTLSKN